MHFSSEAKGLKCFIFWLLLPWDAGAHSGEFIYGLENFVYKDIKPGGYAWLIIFNFIKTIFLSMPELLVESIQWCAIL